MSSTYNYLGIELMATGANAGTWGTKTNTNLNIIQQAASGYHSQSVSLGGTGANTTILAITDGDSTSATDSLTNAARNVIIELTGTITGNKIVTIPNGTEKFYVFKNSTSGAYTVQVKGASDTGAGFTFAGTDKTSVFLYMNGTDITSVSETTEPAGSTGQVQINSSGAFGAVAEGTSGFVLTSNGSGAAPTMQAGGISTGKAIAMAMIFG